MSINLHVASGQNCEDQTAERSAQRLHVLTYDVKVDDSLHLLKRLASPGMMAPFGKMRVASQSQ